MIKKDLVIVGGGPAGMAAAVSAYKNGARNILLLERDQFLGGILNQCIHTGFGLNYFNEVLTGPEYATRFISQINAIKEIEVSLQSFVVKVTPDKILTVLKPNDCIEIQAKSIIMATGCRERTREMIYIPGSRPAGVFNAGLAQKLVNIEGLMPGYDVVIVGSGDIGLIMARRLTLEGARVHAVIEIQQKSKGLKRNIAQCLNDFDIPLYLGHKISRIVGKDRVEKVEVVRVDEKFDEVKNTEFEITCDTVLISAGLIPENDLIEAAGAAIDPNTNMPISSEKNATSINGLFVCGNAYKVYDLVDSVTKESLDAGMFAQRYLEKIA